MSNFNNLVIHVIRAEKLQLKAHKALEVYVSLSTAGKSKYKSKVSTNAVKTDNGSCEFGEHCEFELTEVDAEMHISVNYKTIFGTTESLGQVIFNVEKMTRYQPPTWFRLSKKKGDGKERGQIQLEYQFANKFSSSVSNFSLNKVEKERKFEKLKRKMHLIGRSKKATVDNQSMVSVPLSRKSSFSSNASALAFNSPSPNHMAGGMMLTDPENYIPSTTLLPAPTKDVSVEIPLEKPDIDISFRDTSQVSDQCDSIASRIEKCISKDYGDGSMDYDSTPSSLHAESHKNITSKMRHRAEQILNLRHKKQASEMLDESNGEQSGNNSFNSRSKTIANGSTVPDIINDSRPSSIASSSGFASLGSNNLGALNENTSAEHFLNVIKHLRRELLTKDNRIRDLEEYTDKLLSKIIIHYPELLQVTPKPLSR